MVLLKDIILILFLAIVIILILSKLRIPPVIGFLLTGVIIGPSALQLVKNVSEIEFLAEIGIILLMFTIGLEFSVDKIRKMKNDFLFFGGLQVLTGWILFFYLLHLYGLVLHQALLGGFILALSSTAIVLKLLQDNDELNTPAGMKMTGILLFQDAIIIPALILLPFISQLGQSFSLNIGLKILLALGSVAGIYIFSKWILPKIFNVILKLRVPDLLTVSVFVYLFGVAILAHTVGVSLAMGAFIVGVAISDSDYAHQITTEIIPSRHVFNSIFFISIGMFVNVSFLWTHLAEIAIMTSILIFVKIVLIMGLFLISRNPLNIGVMTAFGLAHIGEFSFILLKVAQEHIIFSTDIHQFILASAILSMFSLPFAMKIGRKLSGFEIFKKEMAPSSSLEPLKNHTILAGFGITGQNIARILKLLNIPYTVAEMNPTTVMKFKASGESIHFGNIDRRENMMHLGIKNASLVVIAVNDLEASKRTISLVRHLNPAVKIIVRVNYLAQVEILYNLGADLVLSQDMETSLIFIHHILKFYNMPDHVSRIQTNMLRKEHYRFFLKEESRDAWKIAIADSVEQDNELFFISPYSKHVLKRLGDLEPFTQEECLIIGVIRHNTILTESLKDLVIESLDTIIFSGNHAKVFEALTWMEKNN